VRVVRAWLLSELNDVVSYSWRVALCLVYVLCLTPLLSGS
jgi:hypothetical protein